MLYLPAGTLKLPCLFLHAKTAYRLAAVAVKNPHRNSPKASNTGQKICEWLAEAEIFNYKFAVFI
jgi:hypothetical protein